MRIQSLRLCLQALSLMVDLVQKVTQVPKGLLAGMAFPEKMDSLDLQVLLELLASVADPSFPKWLTAVINPVDQLNPDHLAQWVPVAPLELQVPPALRDSLDPQASPVSLVLLVQWVLAALLVLLARMEMMVSLAKLVVLVSVELLALRVLVAFLELLDFLASRDTEVSLV